MKIQMKFGNFTEMQYYSSSFFYQTSNRRKFWKYRYLIRMELKNSYNIDITKHKFFNDENKFNRLVHIYILKNNFQDVFDYVKLYTENEIEGEK